MPGKIDDLFNLEDAMRPGLARAPSGVKIPIEKLRLVLALVHPIVEGKCTSVPPLVASLPGCHGGCPN